MIVKQLLKRNQYVGKRAWLFPTNNIRQIVLHHTQGSTADGAISWWGLTPEPVGTNFIIDKDGTIVNTIPVDCWAYTLGMSSQSNNIPSVYKTPKYARNIEQMGVSIELVSEGELVKMDDTRYLFEDGGRFIDKSKVTTLDKPHRGYKHYVSYTTEQIKSLELLIKQLSNDFSIPISGKHDIFDINYKALQGEKGIFSHVCYRSKDKTDVFPQPELITMLNSL